MKDDSEKFSGCSEKYFLNQLVRFTKTPFGIWRNEMRSSLLSNSSFTYVLYAEDDPINIIVMKNYLSFYEEIKLFWVENVLEAVKLIKKRLFVF